MATLNALPPHTVTGVTLTGLLLVSGGDSGSARASSLDEDDGAVTFDDLPFVNVGGKRGHLPAARQTTTEILKVLQRHQAPAVGFVKTSRQLDTSD